MINRLLRALVYSQVWIACGAVCQVFLAGLYSHPLAGRDAYFGSVLLYGLAIGCGSLGFYAFHRLYTLRRLMPDLPNERWRSIHAMSSWLKAMVFVGTLSGLLVMIQLPLRWWILAAVPAVISALYVLPIFSGRRLRDLGRWKLPALVLGWVWLCSAVPAFATRRPDYYYLLERALFIGGFALAFDWRDVALDQAHGVNTWAARLNRRGSAAVSAALLAGSVMLCAFALDRSDYDSFVVAVVQGISSLIALPLVLASYRRRPPSQLYYGFWLDALLVLPMAIIAALLVLLSFDDLPDWLIH